MQILSRNWYVVFERYLICIYGLLTRGFIEDLAFVIKTTLVNCVLTNSVGLHGVPSKI